MASKDEVNRLGTEENYTPGEIVRHEFFTRQEKLDLLRKLKAEATGAAENEDGIGFTPEEIEQAIEEVKAAPSEGYKHIVNDQVAGR